MQISCRNVFKAIRHMNVQVFVYLIAPLSWTNASRAADLVLRKGSMKQLPHWLRPLRSLLPSPSWVRKYYCFLEKKCVFYGNSMLLISPHFKECDIR